MSANAHVTIIRDITQADIAPVVEIYNHYVLNTLVTFDEQPVDHILLSERICDVISDDYPWVVAAIGDQVVGFAYACAWRMRSAYQFTAEISVYLQPQIMRKGLGRSMYTAVFERLAKHKVRSVMAVIALPNPQSVQFHRTLGFEKVAHLRKVGFKFDRWLDVAYWQKSLRGRL